jgi:DNA-binding NarL/FixJ family response regulator
MKPIRVIVADDHAVMRQGLRALFGETPDILMVGEAKSGRDVLACVESLMPDVVIMDISMPELNGIEATRKLREKWSGVQVVILSMHADAEYLFRALQAGAAGYLLKESAVSEIISAIRAVCSGRRYIGAEVSLEGAPPGMFGSSSSPLDSLSAREREVLQLVVEGHSSAEIGTLIHLSPKTVESYRSRLMKKLLVKDLPALVKFAVQHGLTRTR